MTAHPRRLQLCLLRHAHAGDSETWSGPDGARPLSAKGRAQAARLADFLAGVAFRTDVVVSSPKLRALETAQPLAARLGLEVVVDDRLAGGGLAPGDVEAILADRADPGRAVLVGHDPDFSDLLATLTGSEAIPMRKGALARLDLERPLAPDAAVLRWLVPPDLLEREA